MNRPALLLSALALAAASAAHAEGDPVAGKTQFAPCAVCHSVEAGGPNKVGPNLHGVFGKKAATNQPKFAYSQALKDSGLVWTEDKIKDWIVGPAALVPGTKMEYVGIRRAARDNVVAYLKEATQ